MASLSPITPSAAPLPSGSVRRPYRNLTLVSAAHAVCHSQAVLMPLIYPFLIIEYGISITQIGLILGISNLFSGLLQLLFGEIGRYRSRKAMLGVGNILIGLSVAGTALVTGFFSLFGWTLVGRIATSPQHPVGASLLSDTFARSKRGFALAAHVAGGNVGTVAVPLLAAWLIHQYGWRPTLVIFAIPGVVIGLTLLLLAQEAPRSEAAKLRKPGNRIRTFWSDIRLAFDNRTIILLMLATLIAAGGRGIGIVTTYVPLYFSTRLHLNPTYVSILFTILLLGSVVGPLVSGRISDLWGRKAVLLATYSASALATVFFLGVGAQSWLLLVAVVLMGLVVYAESPLLQAFLADVADERVRDTVFGVYFALAFGIGSLWASLIGWLIDHAGYTSAFWVMAASYAVAALIIIPTRDPKRKATHQ